MTNSDTIKALPFDGWGGETAYYTRHSYGTQQHRTERDAQRWLEESSYPGLPWS